MQPTKLFAQLPMLLVKLHTWYKSCQWCYYWLNCTLVPVLLLLVVELHSGLQEQSVPVLVELHTGVSVAGYIVQQDYGSECNMQPSS